MKNPLRPEEVAAGRITAIPDGVIDTFNELIEMNFRDGTATVLQEDVIAALLARGVIADRSEAFDRHLLDVEPVYEAAGWTVTYDKPGFSETGVAWFMFTPGS
jgi:hypothetical protein